MNDSITVKPLRLRENAEQVLSVSVDCDGIQDYANFAPAGTDIDGDEITYRVLIPRLLELFEKHRITATFFCIGERLTKDRGAAATMQQAVSAGHAVGNHSFSHPDMSTRDEAQRRHEVLDGHQAIIDALHLVPVGYRGPAYHMSEATFDALAELGYSYDSSACPAPLLPMALRILGLIRRDYRRKLPAELQRLFSRDQPAAVDRAYRKPILEWPIPVALGLAFYGTFHAISPKLVFHAHHRRLRSRKHLHYELHPIEVLDARNAGDHPWLPTSRIAREGKRDLIAWLDERLGKLVLGRRVVTLEELSAAHLPLC